MITSVATVVGGVAPPLDSPPAPTSDLVIGTALRETAVPTISPVVPAASNVVHSRTTLPEVSTATSRVLEDLAAVIDPAGNLATGYVPGEFLLSFFFKGVNT